MKVTYNWLKDYVNISWKPEALAQKLTMAGLEVTSLDELDGDYVFEMEITSNRPDLLSVIGIAREISALAGKKIILPKPAVLKARSKCTEILSIRIEDSQCCARYLGIILRNLSVGPSPKWMVQRLEKLGLRSVNNIVDITNFCQLEWGQPIHAFDLDKIQGNICVRRAVRQEKIRTIDGEERELDESILVIADDKRPVAIAGIMGGKDTEVQDSTKNILLELAVFNPVTIRKGSKRLGLSSESSYRFERGVDLDNCPEVAKRCAQLIIELASDKKGQKPAYISKILDAGKKNAPKKTINIRPEYVNNVLGASIKAAHIKKILVSLGLKPVKQTKAAIGFLAPSFRKDLQIEEDLIEEIARVYGFDKIEQTLPHIKPKNIPVDTAVCAASIVRDTLVGQGLCQVVSYSLVGKDVLDKTCFNTEDLAQIENPLTSNQGILRPTIIPGILSCIANNLNHQNEDIKVFEIGNIFTDKEATVLAIGLVGDDYAGVLPGAGKFAVAETIYHLKGLIECILFNLGVKDYKFNTINDNLFAKDNSLALNIGKQEYGRLGQISSQVLDKFDIKKEKVFLAEIKLYDLIKVINLERKYVALNPYPFIIRHISLFLEQDLTVQRVFDLIRDLRVNYLVDTALIDFYQGKNTPQGYKGLTLSLKFQATDHTLREQEIDSLHKLICQKLEEKLKAQIR